MFRSRHHQLKNDAILKNAGKENETHFSQRSLDEKRDVRRARAEDSSNRLFSSRCALRPPTAPLTRRGNLAEHDHVWWKKPDTRRPQTTGSSSMKSKVLAVPKPVGRRWEMSTREASTRLALGAGTTVVRYSSFETHVIARRGKRMHALANQIHPPRDEAVERETASELNFAVDRPDPLPVFYPQISSTTSVSSTGVKSLIRTRSYNGYKHRTRARPASSENRFAQCDQGRLEVLRRCQDVFDGIGTGHSKR